MRNFLSRIAAVVPLPKDRNRYLAWPLTSGFFTAIFTELTFFGSAFVLFLSQLGLPKVQIGLALSLLPFSGLLAPLIAPAVARFGFKRSYLLFYGLRYGVTLLLLLVPYVGRHSGSEAALMFVLAVIAAFAMCRAVAETGYYPWYQEFVANDVRGRFLAAQTIITAIGVMLAVWISKCIIGNGQGLSPFIVLIGIGGLCGFIGLLLYLPVPGGAPIAAAGSNRAHAREMVDAIKDINFIRYLAGWGLFLLATAPAAFLPLFMKEQVGLKTENIVLLDFAGIAGRLLSGFFLGWAADRRGSKAVLSLCLAVSTLPTLGWLLMPRYSALSFPMAFCAAFVYLMATLGVSISCGRILFNSAIPVAKKTAYTAVYYAWSGLIGGVAPLVGGFALAELKAISGKVLFLHLDPYTALFGCSLVLTALCYLAFRGLRDEETPGIQAE